MEILKECEIYDEFKVTDGIKLKVRKYKILKKEYITDKIKSNEYKKKVSGLTNFYQLKKDLELDNGMILNKGTYIYSFWNNSLEVVEPASNINDIHVEITSAGGSISGKLHRVTNILDEISEFIKERYDR